MIESEKNLERKLKREVEKIGGWCIKFIPTHINGLPDRICLLPGGITFFAEIKTTKKTPKKIQLFLHRKLRKLGFRVEIIDTSSQIKEIIESYENK